MNQRKLGCLTLLILLLKRGLFLTTVLDLFDGKVIGWSLNKDMTTENTTLEAFKRAKRNRSFKKGLIFQSDQGMQITNVLTI